MVEMPHAVLITTLKSWRALWLFTLPPLGIVLQGHCTWAAAGLFMLIGVIWYHCWRLWLDQRYFSLMNDGVGNDALGGGLAEVWQLTRLRSLTLAERQQGAVRCLKRTLWMALILWTSAATMLLCR